MSFTTRVPGAVFTEREHIVPLDHARPAGPAIAVFTREVADPDGLDRPYLLFLQGELGTDLRTWITDEYVHNALRADGERVLDRLIDLTRGRA